MKMYKPGFEAEVEKSQVEFFKIDGWSADPIGEVEEVKSVELEVKPVEEETEEVETEEIDPTGDGVKTIKKLTKIVKKV